MSTTKRSSSTARTGPLNFYQHCTVLSLLCLASSPSRSRRGGPCCTLEWLRPLSLSAARISGSFSEASTLALSVVPVGLPLTLTLFLRVYCLVLPFILKETSSGSLAPLCERPLLLKTISSGSQLVDSSILNNFYIYLDRDGADATTLQPVPQSQLHTYLHTLVKDTFLLWYALTRFALCLHQSFSARIPAMSDLHEAQVFCCPRTIKELRDLLKAMNSRECLLHLSWIK